MPAAIKKLATLMQKGKSESVRRLCANDLIEHGHQRKGVNPLAGLLGDDKTRIEVNLITFDSSAHGREVLEAKGREVTEVEARPQPAEVEPAIHVDLAEPLDVTAPDPLLDIVITNPGDRDE